MKSHPLMIVRVDISPEVEAEWNEWYDQVHLPEILKVTGFISGRRYRAVEGSPKYMALYELESVNVLTSEAFQRAKGWGKFAPQISGRTFNVYEPINPSR